MIISRTPFRISFFGGGTDYPAWYEEHGGAVLSTTIDKYCYITCRYLPPFFEHKHRIVYSKIENVVDVDDIEHPAVREVLKYLKIDKGVEIHHDADLPARSGLGSSSAFTVGILNALHALQYHMPTKLDLTEEAIHVERALLNESVGSQDQVACAYGGFNRIGFSTDGHFVVEKVILSPQRLDDLQSHLMLYFTGFSRFASEIAAEQIKCTRDRQIELSAMLEMVDEAQDVLINGDILDFGRLLDCSWQLKRSLTDKISNREIDSIYEGAMDAGALGGKLLGAGGGGFMLLFARPEDQPKVRERLSGLLEVGFRFETTGSQIPYFQPAEAR